MGTNFYLEYSGRMPAAFKVPRIHIGKSSAGWCFALHVYPTRLYESELPETIDPRPVNLGQWIGLLESTAANASARIVDEYGSTLTVAEMVETITDRAWSRVSDFPNRLYRTEAEFHRINRSERGPNGLLRHQIGDSHCIAHGDGTWDLIVGDFS